MAIHANDVIKASLRSTYQGQQCENVFWYRADLIVLGSDLNEFANAFQDKISGPIAALCNTGVSFTQLVVEDLDGDRDFLVRDFAPGTFGGTRTGTDQCAPFLAFGIKLSPTTRLVRPGHKRIPGVLEADMTSGGYWSSTALGLMNDLGQAMIEALTGANGDAFSPVIVGFPHPAGEHSPARPTRVTAVLGSYNVPAFVTTQNSRKYGHGT